jgi:CheY-like chemotaxis protein
MFQETGNLFREAVHDRRRGRPDGLGWIELMQGPFAKSLHILVVDDNEVNRLVAKHVLNRLGHTWVTASSGQEALLALVSEGFDLVLMDIQMPEMDGMETTRRIREYERSRGGHLPIIALTALVIGGDRERFRQCGFDGYVPKPIRVDDLVEAMHEVSCPAGVADR